MAKVLLIQPWNYHDEKVKKHNLQQEWRNAPYSLLLLATILKQHRHATVIVDMERDLIALKGDVDSCLLKLQKTIKEFKPDIIGFTFFSVHYNAIKKAVAFARKVCSSNGLKTIFIAGGIHASIEPESTVSELGFDYAFVGPADIGIIQLADGQNPQTILGIYSTGSPITRGKEVESLDSLPYPDWNLCDYKFYAFSSYAKLGYKRTESLDMIMGRGCAYKCAFCAYNTLSEVNYYSPEYLVDQVLYMKKEFGVSGIYFTDSTIGNNKKILREFCELMIQSKLNEKMHWYANMRVNQVNEVLLRLMWKAGCRYLLYGFESASQRVLELMNKKTTVDENYHVAELHNKLKFPYNASMLFGYPGEREEDVLQTLNFLQKVKPPRISINWYVPLPGSPDYDKLKADGKIQLADPLEWRRIGEVNNNRVYTEIPEKRFRELFSKAQRIANTVDFRVIYHFSGLFTLVRFTLHYICSSIKFHLIKIFSQ